MNLHGLKINCAIVLVLTAGCGWVSLAQTATQSLVATAAVPPGAFALDVIAQDAKTTAILPKLSKDDFRVLDNGHEVPVVGFGSGTHYSVTPIALWLVLSCNSFVPPDFSSGFMRGKTQFLRPALANLDKTDAVGVAHWCGDGSAAIDLSPGPNADAAIGKLDDLLKEKSVEGANRRWQTAMQKMIEMILDDTRHAEPRRLPVLVFLYGDAGSAFVNEADDMLRAILPAPGFVFGLNNDGYHYDPRAMFGSGEIYFQIHYLSQETGGQVYGTPDPKMFANALGYVLLQLHFRYTLNFVPPVRDGKKHDLKVELTREGQAKYASAVLRYRPQYIPAASP